MLDIGVVGRFDNDNATTCRMTAQKRQYLVDLRNDR
jgi:hypothetical protein